MCDCFHIAFPNWHAASAGAGPGRRLRGPEPGTDDNSICDEASQFTEEERPRPQGSSPVDEFPESDKYGDSDKECEAEHDPYQKRGKKPKKSGLGSIFDKRSTPKMSKLKEAPSPEAGVIVKTAKDGGAEGLVYSGGGKDGIFIKEVVPESPASKNLHLKEGDQVLSATVYFDNIPYEDAIQILEHAQAYKVKLCLKRKPELTETEGALDSDAIPEDEVHPPEMREHGKKRRGDARISWPKFPTLGRGKKSRFTRSHSSSEADEQRKLELSPTTSDTESPIKSQDALKGKKKHKIKLPGLRRGRISSSEETDAQNIQTEDMISPECLESPSRETQDMEDEQKKCEKVEKIETEAYKVEVVCLDSTLKTTDITAALVEQETLSTTASPDGKKKKKERSELKLKILGRDKKHKAKSSPKRLKTLGASLEKTDDKENEKTEVIPNSEAEKVTTEVDVPKLSSSKSSQLELHLPKVEIDLSDVGIGIICKPKAKGTEEKQSKTGFKLPKVGLGDVPTEEIIKIDASVEESKATRKDDAYETLLKGTELPKREDIEIPGMEDVSKITKDLKEARAPLATISDAELQAETVQMSIDVESVKEAVSKLPGYKLPKVDMSGVPIPEEITVIDANAQRISVKTPTKGKQESKSAFTEISKTTVKLPNDLADVSRRESSSGTKIDVKKLELESKDVTISTRAIISHTIEVEKVQKENVTFSYESEETHKNLDIGMKTPKANLPDLSVSKPEIKIPDFKIDLKKSSETKDDKVEGERTIFLPEDKDDAKLPDEKSLPTEEKFDIASKESSAILKTQTENQKDISVVEKKTKSPEKHDKGMKFKMPTVGISMPKVKGSKVDMSEGILQMDVEKPKLEIKTQETDILKEAKCEIELKSPDASLSKSNIDVPLQDTKGESTGELETQDGKFKLPKLGLKMPKITGPEVDVSISKKDIDVTQQDVKDPLVVPATDVTLLDISEKSLRSEIDIKAPTIGGNIENKDSKFKMPTLSVKLPKVKAPQIDISLSRKDTEETQPKGKQVMDIFQTPDISSPEKKIAKTESEVEGQEGKFKMPKLGITMPKLKGPEIDVNLSKKEDETALRDVNTDSNMATLTSKEEMAKECVTTPETMKLNTDVAMDMIDPAIDAKASKFKIPKFEVSMPKVKEPKIDINLIKKDKAVKPTDPKAEMKMPDIAITVGKLDVTEGKMESEKTIVASGPLEAKVDIKTPEFNIPVTEADGEVQSEKFQIPRFTIAIPKVKGPEVDLSSQNKDVDVALPEAKIKGELPKVDVEIKSPEIDTKLESQSGKFKIPKFDIKMPKVKGPEIDISFPKKEVKSPEIKADIKLPEVPKADVNFGELEVKIPDAKMKFKKPDAPPLQVKPPSGKIKIKAPDIDVSVTEESPPKFKIPSPGFTNNDVTMPKLPEVESEVISGKAEIKEPDREKSAKGSPLKFKMPTIKLPTIGFAIEEKVLESDVTEVPQVDVDLPDVKAEISLPQTQVKAALGELEVEQPSGIELDEKFKKPRFSLPRFSFSKASVPAPEVDVSAPEVNAPDTGLKIEVKEEADVKAPTLEAQTEEKGSKFKLPKFGLSMPKISAPEIDLSLSKKDTEVTLPEAKVEEKLPDVDIKAPSVEADIKIPEVKVESKTKEGSPSKIKMPMFKLPKFGVSIPETEIKTNETDAPKLDVDMPDVKAEVTVPNVDINAPSVELEIEQPPGLEIDAKFKKPRFSLPRFSFSKGSVPAPEVDVSAPEESIPKITGELEVKQDIDVKQPELEAQTEGQGSKFKLPKFGITIPKLSATDIDLSLSRKDIEVTLPEAKAEGKLPNVEVKAPVIEAEIKVPDIKVESKTKDGSPSKLKMPTFKLPKFGTSLPEMESKTDGTDAPQVDVDLPEAKAEIILPDVDVKAPSVELEIEKPPDLEIDAKFKKPRFSLPRFSFSKASAPAPELDVTAPVIHIPDTEGKVEVKGEMDIKVPELEPQIEEKGSKFKLPKFGIAMPKISAPDMDVSLSKGEVEVTLPEANVSKTEVNAPSLEVQMKAPEVKVESKTKEGSPSKLKMPTFKLPKFGASIPEVEKKDEADVVIPQVDVELPDVKVEVSLPEADIKASPVELKIEQPSDLEMDAKFKKPRFSLPRFSFSKPNVSAPEIDVNAPEVNISKTDSKVEVEEQETMAPKIDAQIDGQGSKFKLPKFGIAMPKFSAPDIDLNISKKDFEGTLPEAQVESQLPDVEVKVPSTETEIKAPEIKLESRAKEESPSKLKMPTFKFPKFGVSIPETENKMEKTDVQLDVDLPEVKEEANLIDVDVKAPSIELEIEKPAGLEIDAKFKKPRFSLPRFSFSKASIPAPEVDAPEENVPETEAKAEVKEEIDVKASEIKAQIDGQGSKFKLPKFGIAMPKISAPEIDLNLSKPEVEVNLAEAKNESKISEVDVKTTSIEAESKAQKIKIDSKTKEGSPSKLKMPTFKLPTFGASIPEAETKTNEAEITISKVDVALPDIKAEIPPSDVDIKVPSGEAIIEQPPGLEMDAKFKKPRFSLPRFSFSKASAPAPEVDVRDLDVNDLETESKMEVKVEIDEKDPELQAPIDGQRSKFKLPKFGIAMPKISAPEIDLSISKKDVEEETLSEVKTEGNLPDVEVKAPSVEADNKIPDVKVESKTKEGSPSKLKMPTFKLPKFGASIQEAEIKVEKTDVTVPQVDIDLPDIKAEVNLPDVDINAPSGEVVVEQPSGLEMDAKFKKPRFSLPRFSFSKPSVPAPDDEVNISETEGKSEVKDGVDVKAPELETQIEEQGSKFKLPKFGISMPKISAPEIDMNISKKDVDTKVDGTEVTIPQVVSSEAIIEQPSSLDIDPKFKKPRFSLPRFSFSKQSESAQEGDIDAPEVNVKELVDIKVSEPEEKRSKFKLPSLGFSTPDIDVTQKDVEIKSFPAKVDVQGGEGESSVEGSPSKFKMPSFKLPKFGVTAEIDEETPKVSTNTSDKDVKDEVKEETKESKGSWSLRKISFSKPSPVAPEVDIKAQKVDVSVSESKKEVQSPEKKSLTVAVGHTTSDIDALKKPRFSLPKISFGKQPSIETEAEVDVSLPTVEIRQTDGEETQESKFKMPTFGISLPKVKSPEIDLNLSKKDANINSPGAKIEPTVPKTDQSEVPMESPQKGASWSFPRFSFSKQVVTVESDADVKTDFTEESTLKHEANKEDDSPAVEPEIKSKFSLPRFSFSKASAKEPTIPENTVAVEVSLSEGEVKIKESKATGPAVQGTDTRVEIQDNDAKSKDIGGSPSKFKMPIFKMPKIGITTTFSEDSNNIIKETEEILQITKDGKVVEIITQSPSTDVKMEASIKGPSMDIKSEVPKASTPDQETAQGDTLGSPSKFKLPSFKMPRLSFSKPKPDDEPADSKTEENQLDTDSKEKSKSPSTVLPSFGDFSQNIDVEIDVPNPDENLKSPSKGQSVQKQQDLLKERKQEATKSPEKTGWFKFSAFGLSSPTEAAADQKKEEKLDNKSPVDLTENDELSPSCSIQSSEAFADISSTMTSENVGISLSSPTRVTAKYSDPDSAPLAEETHSKVVMSTTKTEVISVEPNLPEKVTILSSGLSSSSEETLKLASGKIHIVTSNIQATPESQQAKMFTSIHVQSAEGVSSQDSWTVTDSQSSMSMFKESHVVRESSSESKEVVITKQITRVVTDETASSIKQLKDSVHTEKMKFFDEAEK